jgi:HMG (high mobility group) box
LKERRDIRSEVYISRKLKVAAYSLQWHKVLWIGGTDTSRGIFQQIIKIVSTQFSKVNDLTVSKILMMDQKSENKSSLTSTGLVVDLKAPTSLKEKVGHMRKPKRALSAYNVFFQLERERLLSGKHSGDGVACDWKYTLNDVIKIYLRSLNKDDSIEVKRKHCRTHGKIGFAALARTIAGRWKTLSNEDKAVFQAFAETDKKRYKSQITEFNKMNIEVKSDHGKTMNAKNKKKVDPAVTSSMDSVVPKKACAMSLQKQLNSFDENGMNCEFDEKLDEDENLQHIKNHRRRVTHKAKNNDSKVNSISLDERNKSHVFQTTRFNDNPIQMTMLMQRMSMASMMMINGMTPIDPMMSWMTRKRNLLTLQNGKTKPEKIQAQNTRAPSNGECIKKETIYKSEKNPSEKTPGDVPQYISFNNGSSAGSSSCLHPISSFADKSVTGFCDPFATVDENFDVQSLCCDSIKLEEVDVATFHTSPRG